MDDKIIWCLNQKRGISLIEPNNDLMEAYFMKAENSLRAVRNEKDNPEWEITAGYYTIYFSIYALLMKAGIKSEIHSCTIELITRLFREYFTDEQIELISLARDLRENIQYYLPSKDDIEKSRRAIEQVSDFHIECKRISRKIDDASIKKIRNRIHG